ncbi:hypothetical protein K443DRAFT_649484 [Laccaria amethystina LaAM-08-1]|uniref:Unplaced genomic scaffold K443scaffold_377, whole genome shotgun sequence n=1 Tax=Laccaria amethystina LaAM-08-1 TaxID=1095629 RepID=A0A0C9WNY9_9AGAR|nr:hypothetical protein K443DRAFT_649484 [Laccaria amethystina LaAM-08-1]
MVGIFDPLHPMASSKEDLFNDKKRILEEGGVAELEETASGGNDIATLLSGFFLSNSRLPFFLTQYVLLSPHLTVQANQAADEHDKITDEVVIANMSAVFLAGQDTTASSLTRLMCMMAENPNLQAHLLKEILDARALSAPFFLLLSASENVLMTRSQD